MIFDKGYSIRIDGLRCLNRRHHGVQCDHCRRHCPANAVIIDQDRVDLDSNLCNGCGLCLSDCPTQVFSSGQWDETSVIGRVNVQGWKITEFFCARHLFPYQEDHARNRGAVQLPACLSIMSRGGWYELGLKTAIELHLDQCEGCPMSQTIPRLEWSIGTAAEWLAASGHHPEFSFIHSGGNGGVKKRQKAVETGLKVTSRRDLFLSLISRGEKAAKEMLTGQTSHPEVNDPEKFHSVVPDWLKRLSELYPSNMKESSSSAFWPTIKINDHCVHCSLCTLFCPSGALQNITSDGACAYTYKAGLCLDCRICQLVCDRQAIIRDKETLAYPFDTAVIYQSPVIECHRCGRMASDASTGLCYWCQKEAVIEHAFKDACQVLLNPSGK